MAWASVKQRSPTKKTLVVYYLRFVLFPLFQSLVPNTGFCERATQAGMGDPVGSALYKAKRRHDVRLTDTHANGFHESGTLPALDLTRPQSPALVEYRSSRPALAFCL